MARTLSLQEMEHIAWADALAQGGYYSPLQSATGLRYVWGCHHCRSGGESGSLAVIDGARRTHVDHNARHVASWMDRGI